MIYPLKLRSRIFYIPLVLGSIVASVYLVGIIFGFLGILSSVITIVITAFIIAIVLKPLVHFFIRKGISSTIAILLSFAILFSIIALIGVFIIPSLYDELNFLTLKLSLVNINERINLFFIKNHLEQFNIGKSILYYVSEFTTYLLNNSINLISNVLAILFGLFLSFFFAFYFLQEGEIWETFLFTIIPESFHNDYKVITHSIVEGIYGFIKGQTIVAFIIAIATMIIMKILGLNLIVVTGVYAFIGMFIPIIGPFIVMILPLLIAAGTSMTTAVILFISLFIIIQIVVNIVQPKIFSKSLGIHPVLSVLSVLIGVQLFGIGGALLALPIASILQSLLIHYFNNK